MEIDAPSTEGCQVLIGRHWSHWRSPTLESSAINGHPLCEARVRPQDKIVMSTKRCKYCNVRMQMSQTRWGVWRDRVGHFFQSERFGSCSCERPIGVRFLRPG